MNDAEAMRIAVETLREQAVKWGKRADEAVAAKHFLDAQQHLRRSNELVLSALKLEQTLTTEGVMK